MVPASCGVVAVSAPWPSAAASRPFHRVFLLLLLLREATSQRTVTTTQGLLGEYFFPDLSATEWLAESCRPGNGSTNVLKGMVPNITRTDGSIDFADLRKFYLKRCAWDLNGGNNLFYNCRGIEPYLKNFAVRWSGYIVINIAGDYSFELTADDGARIVMGNSAPPMRTTWDEVENVAFRTMFSTQAKDDTVAVMCGDCAEGKYGRCWVTPNGCEPFSYWSLELDGGVSGTCQTGERTSIGTRYMPVGVHPICVEYFQRGGPGKITLRWKGPQSKDKWETLPPTAFRYPDHYGFRREVFEVQGVSRLNGLPRFDTHGGLPKNAQFVMSHADGLDAYSGMSGHPWAPKSVGQFAQLVMGFKMPVFVRWTGFFKIETGGDYKFKLESDDGSRMVLGGRGDYRETEVVLLDGKQVQATPKIGATFIEKGWHPVRFELFYNPIDIREDTDGTALNPPGLRVFYSGADTGAVQATDQWVPLTDDDAGSRFKAHDPGCPLRNWKWGVGMSVNRDCAGECFEGNERSVGDYICDKGSTSETTKRLSLGCSAWNQDNGDCGLRPTPVYTTPRPRMQCLASSASGEFKRHSDASCADPGPRGTCMEYYSAVRPPPPLTLGPSQWEVGWSNPCEPPADDPGYCDYGSCCTAMLQKVEFWNTMCIAFGALKHTNCSYELGVLLKRLNKFEPTVEALAAKYPPVEGVNKFPLVTGYIMTDCVGDLCNAITDEEIKNPWTMMSYKPKRYVCPLAESQAPGIQCYEGPWDITGVKNPFTECQNNEFGVGTGQYKWNFCLNRKTPLGKPFSKCCAYVFVNNRGQVKCQFQGLAYGTCADYIVVKTEDSASDPYTAISNPVLLKECLSDLCNEPDDPDEGCPDSIDKFPPQTASAREDVERVPTLEEMMVDAPPKQAEPPNFALGGVILASFALTSLSLFCIWYCFKKPEEPLFHSSKAKVVADDTFIELEQDHDLKCLGNANIGVVKPRPHALRMRIEEHKFRVPACIKDKLEAENGFENALALPWTAADMPQQLDLAALQNGANDFDTVSQANGDSPNGKLRQLAFKDNESRKSTARTRTTESDDIVPVPMLLPGQQEGQFQEDGMQRRGVHAIAAHQPVATAMQLALTLREDCGSGGQADLFPSLRDPPGPYTLAALGMPQQIGIGPGTRIIDSGGAVMYGAPGMPQPQNRPAAVERYERLRAQQGQQWDPRSMNVCT
eukprot:TRINITY_DN30207_c0_g1_i2.p1 TRINITY_DN30207_c0_g1~~TRINITY_DN30207_c0_g1_i2.p1  ORF type:complete len:1205 (+),score=265.24 TRINITY_DN30207_c0_g1_i2:105-3719(+)